MSDVTVPPAADACWAFDRYEAVRHRLPSARFADSPAGVSDLGAVAGRFDAFLLDAYGVLNVGDHAVPGAVARISALRAAGKRLMVLTNAASYPLAAAVSRFRRMGFDFAATEVVSSRDVAAAHLTALLPGATWGAIAAEGDDFADIAVPVIDLVDRPEAADAVDGLLLLSSLRWDDAVQKRLLRTLERRLRPVVVANPDVVAPREGGLSLEPGLYAHDLADRTGATPRFFGKPFGNAFDAALARLPGIPRNRIAMVGDTLHTDVLGGAAAGLGTVLIEAHGMFAGHDVHRFIAGSGIVPDFVARTT